MPVIESQIDVQSEEFESNRATMLAHIENFRAIENKVIAVAAKAKERFHQKGKLLPRERLGLLLDKGAPFLELMSLAGYQMHDDTDGSLAGGCIIGGIGYIEGIRCMLYVHNSAYKGGTITPSGLHKNLRLQAIAEQNKLPIVTLAESGGANLNYATEVFIEGAYGFANQSRLSAKGIPQVTVVHGNATAGGAYQPGLSDYTIVIKEKTKMFLAGPPLLKAATGEESDDESLGGAALHAYEAGTAEFLAEDDRDGIRIARDVLASLPWNQQLAPKHERTWQPPLYSEEELLGIVPNDPKKPYDVREIIARIADGSEFVDFKRPFDEGTVCGFLKIEGHHCGLIGNNAPITPNGAAKASQFIQLCEQSNLPILFFHNTTGFLVGTETEKAGVIKHGAKMIQAVANTSVPKLTIVVGGSYGAGNFAMCGRGLNPHFIFAWPNSKTAVMGGAQAGKVMRIVAEEKHKKNGTIPDVKEMEALESAVSERLDQSASALFGTARLWDDGLIDPRDTRRLLSLLLDICDEAKRRPLKPITFGVARF